MNICIDTRSPGQTGILSYMNRLLKHLFQIDKKNKYVLIIDSVHGTWGFEGVEEIVVPSLSPIQWMIWSNLKLPRLLEKREIDVYHTLKHITLFRGKTKKVVSFHGLHQHYMMPEIFKWSDSLYWKGVTFLASKCYDRILTDADAEKNYLVSRIGFPESKFRTVNLAGDERFVANLDTQHSSKTKKKLNLPDHFILYLGMIHPRKNIEKLIEGYREAKSSLNNETKLVIAGNNKNDYFETLKNKVAGLGLEADILFTGYLSDKDLLSIYSLADLFLFPSRHEAFGIVLIEAMASGLPVVTSNTEDISEVVGDAAILVDPDNISEISKAILDVLNFPDRKQTMIERSLKRAALFSWDRCARETLEVYNELSQGAIS